MKIDNLKLVGEGNTAEIFDLQDGRVLKLFREGMPKEIIKSEYLNSIAVSNVLGFVPRVYKMCEVGNRTAIVYEKIIGTDFLKIMLNNI